MPSTTAPAEDAFTNCLPIPFHASLTLFGLPLAMASPRGLNIPLPGRCLDIHFRPIPSSDISTTAAPSAAADDPVSSYFLLATSKPMSLTFAAIAAGPKCNANADLATCPNTPPASTTSWFGASSTVFCNLVVAC